MPTAIHRRVALANVGKDPQAIIRLKSGWVMAGDVQPLANYCVLFSDPVAHDLNSLDEAARSQYLLDMARVGDALLRLGSYRINYETWCNLSPALHTHIVPRYLDEPDDKRVLPSRQAYDYASARPFDPIKDREFMEQVRALLAPYARN